MRFQTPLVPARLIRRYKRFLSDMTLDDGREITAHCANPGAMAGLKDPGLKCWLEPNDDPKKKLKFGWRVSELPGGHWVGIDTAVPNRVVKEALIARAVPELAGYETVRPEVKYGQRSRVDFLLTQPDLPDAYVEVKNVHFRREDDWAEFPDSVTERGTRHLLELADMVAQGHRAVMFYLIQRTDCSRLKFAADIDPNYAQTLANVRAQGVEVMAYDCTISPQQVTLRNAIPVD